MREAWARMSNTRVRGDGPEAVHTAAQLAKSVGDRLAPYAEHDDVDPLAPPVAYPEDDDLGRRLSRVAALVAQPLGVRLASVDANGEFDTHDNQPTELADSLRSVSQSLAAFQADLEARGLADRVITLVWSEFGRRVEDNSSGGGGTDHGAGGLAMVIGSHAKGGIAGAFPGISDNQLDQWGNLKVPADYRQIYTSLLEDWMGTDPADVIPNASSFAKLPLVA